MIGKENYVSRLRSAVTLTLFAALAQRPGAARAQAEAPAPARPASNPFSTTAHRLNLQVHGYAAQSALYTTHNNWNLTGSNDGSGNLSDAVVNLTAQPWGRLRVGAQGRYFRLGQIQNKVSLDWAQADFKVNEHLGFRGGKVKSPVGLLNESQDIDPAQLWVLLPQSVYPIASRNSILAHNGGVIYGAFKLGESFGKLEYRAFGGQRALSSDDGYFQSSRDSGFSIPDGASGHASGYTMHWNAPWRGIMIGATEASGSLQGSLTYGPAPGSLNLPLYRQTYYFGRLERGPFMFAGEYNRTNASVTVTIAGYPAPYRIDARAFYAMASYKPARKLTTGLYYSAYTNTQAAFNSFRYQKDWALAGRYDFNTYIYAKLEQHFIDGNAIGISTTDNPNPQPDNRMSMLRLGVSF